MSDINDDIVETLNDLIATCKDGELGFTACAERVESPDLRQLFTQRAAGCRQAAEELRPFVIQYGGEPETEGSTSGALHRGWVAVRGSLAGFSDQAMLDESSVARTLPWRATVPHCARTPCPSNCGPSSRASSWVCRPTTTT